MANKTVFSKRSKSLPPATVTNNAGGTAYELSPEDSLAKLLTTGCISNTFYASAESQLDTVLDLCSKVSPEFLAKAAVYSRFEGAMKDIPAVLLAYLCTTDIDSDTFRTVFNRVVNNGKMLSNFIQIMLSGQINGRKCLGTRAKKAVANWLENRDALSLFNDSIGNSPSIADAIKLAHPTSPTVGRGILFKYLMGFPLTKVQMRSLPKEVREYEAWKIGEHKVIPFVRFEMLTAKPLTVTDWANISINMGYKALIKNLNTLQRNGVLDVTPYRDAVAAGIRDRKSILKSKIFPYELLAAYTFGVDLPPSIRLALQDAIDIATENVPSFENEVLICLDISGSMKNPITGSRGVTVASKMKNIDVASMFAAALLRNNENSVLYGFNDQAKKLDLNPRDSVVRNTTELVKMLGGGTDCASPLALANKNGKMAPLVIMISDNESLKAMTTEDLSRYSAQQIEALGLNTTASLQQWELYRRRVKGAKLVCLDISPNITGQVPNRADILNVAGFNDGVFKIINEFLASGKNSFSWARKIEAVQL